jgi:hypothetical protein
VTASFEDAARDEKPRPALFPVFDQQAPAGPIESFRRFSWENYRAGTIGVDSANRLHRSMFLPAAVTVEVLSAALRIASTRHPALRARALDAAEPWLAFDAEPTVDAVDHGGPAPTAEAVAAMVSPYIWRPFDLTGEPLLRCRFDRFADGAVVTLVLHHFVNDAFSMRLLWSEFLRLCSELAAQGASTAATPALSYGGYLAAMNAWRVSPRGQEQIAAVVDELARVAQAASPPSALEPASAPPPLPIEIGFDQLTALRTVARARRMSLFSLLVAAQAAALSEALGVREVAFWSVTNGRELPGLLNTVGYLADRVAHRVDLTAPGDTRSAIGETWAAISRNARRSFVRSDFVHEALARQNLALTAPGINFTPYLRPTAPSSAVRLAAPSSGSVSAPAGRESSESRPAFAAIPLHPPPRRSGSGRDIRHYWLELSEGEQSLKGSWHPKDAASTNLAALFLRKLSEIAEGGAATS